MNNQDYVKYIKRNKFNKFLILSSQIFIILIFLITWQLLSDFNIINSFIFSSPYKILVTIINLYKAENLFNHILVTTQETLLSFFISSLLGLFIASILWWNKFFANVFEPFLNLINSLPKVALGPIIIIWVGANTYSIILMAISITIIITILNLYYAFITTNENQIKLLKSLGASKIQIFIKLIFPSNFTTFISVLKINISMSLVGVIMGEFLVSKAGIGYLIIYGSQVFNLTLVFTGITLLLFLSLIIYKLVNLIKNKNP